MLSTQREHQRILKTANLLADSRAVYESAWGLDVYGLHSPGALSVPLFQDMAHPSVCDSILDAGCGSGKGAVALKEAGFENLLLCDLTPAGLVDEARGFRFRSVSLWDDLVPQLGYLDGRTVDWVYCCDVLEHIPTPFTMLVVSRLLAVARKGVFLTISLMPDQFGAWVGQPLHLTVQTFPQWREQLSALGTVQEARDLLHSGVYLVKPSC